ncbi:lipopolysaccharide assembly protein LapA domain-containing protein [Hydrogenophaga flava]|uniref:lipopolysaccharide assembly protein LapA domain-containing protein n=1 Tax=Hydrogenophaga flava TaxID=65657 RepID=UPI000825313B|nr:lipopolysaccharide assembly protein LapA domain-containing protein [Hydrogenophaga flava]
MKYLTWLLNAAIFFVLFAFALNNQDTVTMHLFFGARWQAPLVLILLCALLVGVVLGVVVMLPLWLRARRRSAARPVTAPTSLPPAVPDAVSTVSRPPNGT